MQVVKMQHRQHILTVSQHSVKGVSKNDENITWKDGGFDVEEEDY